jgi:chorismate lyase / 3-hydroxybenzoate synthase
LPIASIRDLSALKVYVRDPADVENITARMAQQLGGEIPVMLLRGDICRADLRLEIEGLYTGAGD